MTYALTLAALVMLSVPLAFAQAPAVYEVTLGSLELASRSIESGDHMAASEHITFASTFFANNLGAERDRNIDEAHLRLIDATTFASAGDLDSASESVSSAAQLLDERPAARANDHVEILAVAEKQYRAGTIYSSDTSLDLAQHLVMRVAQLSPDDRLDELAERMSARDPDYRGVADSVAYAQRTIFGARTVEVNDSHLYDTIRSLYDDVIHEAKQGKYAAADDKAVEAYLDNFEYLEAPIADQDEDLMLSLEIDMREILRKLIADSAHPDAIRAHIDDILVDLARAQEITVVAQSDGVIESTLAEPGRALARMGSASSEQKDAVRGEIDTIREQLRAASAAHDSGDYDAAYAAARSAYLDSYELIEIPLRAINPDFTLEVEYQFSGLRNLVNGPAPREDIRAAIAAIESNLDESERLVSGTGELAPAIAFTSSFAIIFREGLESVLILGAILTYLEASRNTRFKRHIMYGILGGIGATAVTWVAAQYIIDISGASRELIEAIAALSATAVLFYVSFWVLNKIEHKRWMEFVKAKVWQATATGSGVVFVMLSFFTIYREGFETVLFYHAMISFAKYSESFVVLGFILGLASLVAIYYVMRRLGRRLPLRALFGLTMGVGAYLSIAFLGNAVRELQVLDFVPYTPMFGIIPRLDINLATMTGIYPTLETTIAQFVLLGIYLIASAYVLVVRPRRAARIEAMRTSRRDTS